MCYTSIRGDIMEIECGMIEMRNTGFVHANINTTVSQCAHFQITIFERMANNVAWQNKINTPCS